MGRIGGGGVSPDEIITEIIKILNLPGEEKTDGECLDMVVKLLEENGHGPVFPVGVKS